MKCQMSRRGVKPQLVMNLGLTCSIHVVNVNAVRLTTNLSSRLDTNLHSKRIINVKRSLMSRRMATPLHKPSGRIVVEDLQHCIRHLSLASDFSK